MCFGDIVHKSVIFYLHLRYWLFKTERYSMIRKNAEAVSRIPFKTP